MKKVFLLLSLFSLVVLNSCSPDEVETPNQNPNSINQNEPIETTSVDPDKVKPPTHG